MGSASKSSGPGRARMTKPTRRASAAQILDLLSQRPMEIYKALRLEPKDANLSIPTDGRGAASESRSGGATRIRFQRGSPWRMRTDGSV